MKETLSQQDWMDISAYLDGRLNASNRARVDARLKTDAKFRQALREIEHTRTLLRALPHKRAPRNFTLSAKYAKAPARRWGLRSFMGLASATSALAVVILFASINFFAPRAMTAAEPAMLESAPVSAPEAMLDASLAATGEVAATPMLFTWGQPNQADGLGGGSDALAGKVFDPYAAGGGGMPEVQTFTLTGTETPQVATDESTSADPSTLILGIPEPGSEAASLDATGPLRKAPLLPSSTWWMIGLGALSLLSGALAIFLRKR